jgi:hypothetical protein
MCKYVFTRTEIVQMLIALGLLIYEESLRNWAKYQKEMDIHMVFGGNRRISWVFLLMFYGENVQKNELKRISIYFQRKKLLFKLK